MKNLLLVLADLMASLLAAEIILRQYYFFDDSNALENRVPHPVYGWVTQPDISYKYVIPDSTVQVRYSQGWRRA